ncbi:hypothetical protein HK096_008233 [Nowakowskiella sp. JEL0078]|nr:hypothetical protein HK096_008233 [Nowakowskiella sp. JEL0078]
MNFFSWLKRDDHQDYESILSKLDGEIRLAEITLSEVGVNEQNAQNMWLYTIPVYILIVIFGYIYGDSTDDDGFPVTWEYWSLKIIFVVLCPIFIYYGRRLISAWYHNKRKTAEAQLENAKAKQNLKIEELKKKTAYYVTKGLIERYETPTRQFRGTPQQRQNTELRQRTPPLNQRTIQTPNVPPQVKRLEELKPSKTVARRASSSELTNRKTKVLEESGRKMLALSINDDLILPQVELENVEFKALIPIPETKELQNPEDETDPAKLELIQKYIFLQKAEEQIRKQQQLLQEKQMQYQAYLQQQHEQLQLERQQFLRQKAAETPTQSPSTSESIEKAWYDKIFDTIIGKCLQK